MGFAHARLTGTRSTSGGQLIYGRCRQGLVMRCVQITGSDDRIDCRDLFATARDS